MKVKELIQQLEMLSPKRYACSWDNVGLLVGRKDQEVKKVIVTLDVTEEVVKKAVEEKADFIVSHHPMIFSSLKQVNEDTVLGRKILTLIENKIACYAMHTNFDVMGGMAQLAEEKLQIENGEPLEVTVEEDGRLEGIGRVGDLKKEMTLKECALFVKEKFHVPSIALFGEEEKKIKRVAICPGSGKGMEIEALKKKADVLITGDIGHHNGIDALEEGLAILDAGHYGLEHMFMEFISNYLEEHCEELEVKVIDSKSPFHML